VSGELPEDRLSLPAEFVAEERRGYAFSDGAGFEKLRVWQAAVDLAAETYAVTASFPSEEKFGITNQMRRSAISVSSNVAEGWGRQSGAEFARFVDIAIGSLCELRSLVRVAVRINHLSPEDSKRLDAAAYALGGMLHRLRETLRR
jgi:four helix bundle protein